MEDVFDVEESGRLGGLVHTSRVFVAPLSNKY